MCEVTACLITLREYISEVTVNVGGDCCYNNIHVPNGHELIIITEPC